MPFELVFRIFGEPGNFPELSMIAVVGANLAWTLGGARGRRLALLADGDRSMTEWAPPNATPLPPPDPVPTSPPPPVTGMIAVNGVSKFFGSVVAVSDVTFAIDDGVTALLGPNGAGKSTLFRMMCGLIPTSRGLIQVLGSDPRIDRAVRGRIGLVPQQDALLDHLTASGFVALSAETPRHRPTTTTASPTGRSTRSSWPTSVPSRSVSSRRACANESRWRLPWSTTPRSSSSTNR